jgi:hypothetical protein
MDRCRLVEAYAGLAGLSLHVLFNCAPPASRIGAKSKYAAEIARRLIPEGVQVDRVLLIDADPAIVNFWRHIPQLPEALAARTTNELPAEVVWRQARAERLRPGPAGAAAWLLWTAGARGGVGGFKGKHKHRPSVDGFIPARKTLLQRVERLATCWNAVDVALCRAEDFRFGPDDIVYLDPPYPGTQGYFAGTTLAQIQQTWANARWARARGLSADRALAQSFDTPESAWSLLPRRGQVRRSLTRDADELFLIGQQET